MDDKSFIAEFAASEMLRINERLKIMVASTTPVPQEMRDSVIKDIELTLSRLEKALLHLKNTDNNEEEKYNEQ